MEGRCYFDEKEKKEKTTGKKKPKPKAKNPTPSPPSSLPPKSPQQKTNKIINSSVGQTNVVRGQRERKKKVVLDL